jgi:hypothetical protein
VLGYGGLSRLGPNGEAAMKFLFVSTALIAAVAFVALTWWPVFQTSIVPPPAVPAVVEQEMPSAPSRPEPEPSTPEPASYAQQPAPQIQMPDRSDAARQGSTGPMRSTQAHRRTRPADSKQGAPVDRSVANGFTAELNRQEVQSLRSGGLPAGAPWRELHSPR